MKQNPAVIDRRYNKSRLDQYRPRTCIDIQFNRALDSGPSRNPEERQPVGPTG